MYIVKNMWNIEAFIFFVLSLVVTIRGGQKCDFYDLGNNECGENEICFESGICQCKQSYEKKGNICIPIDSNDPKSSNYSSLVDNHGSGSIVAGILIPLFLIVFVMCGVYVIRKYDLVSWFRNRFRRRNETYDEFMIGQDDDDEPLS